MGILNITPDSFSDGGRYLSQTAALERARVMLDEGADLIDVGGESTRPGAAALSLDEELRRVAPVVDALVRDGIPVSVDTYKPAVMREVLAAGADMINDIRAFAEPGALAAVVDHGCALCAMHMLGEPRSMQRDPVYADVVTEVRDFLAARVAALQAAGVERARIVVDPGFGFGKTLVHNFTLLARLGATAPAGVPILAGLSRKSMLSAASGGQAPEQRLAASLGAAVCAAERGAAIIRVHDVRATVEALRVWAAVRDPAAQWPSVRTPAATVHLNQETNR